MKKIGGCIYIHKSALNSLRPEQQAFIKNLLNFLPEMFSNFAVIKYNSKENCVTFIKSEDWDIQNEPTVGDSCKVSCDGTIKITKGSNKIYHHKWQFVNEDYKGFDVQKSKERSAHWESVIPRTRDIKSRIQSRDYWNELLRHYNIEL